MQQRYFMKLSIIIPVYNVEKTLQRCVESILNQSFQDFEMILIDDGSTDHSGKIADEMAAKDQRVRSFHQPNGGLSDARNTGISHAKGEYITFADSDDFIGEGTLEPLMQTLATHREYDILEYSVMEHYGGKCQSMRTLPDKVYTDMKEYWLKGKTYCHTYAWNKLYKRSLFETIRFPKGKTFEDALTLPLLLQKTKVVATTRKGTYYYCHNAEGITENAAGKDLENLLEAHIGYITATGNVDAEYYAHILNIQLDVYEGTGNEPKLPLLPFKGTIKLRILHLIGLKRLCKLNRLFHKTIRNAR